MLFEDFGFIINTMKQCTKCKEKKLLGEFNFKVRALGIRQYQCKECTRAFVKSHYKKNKEYYTNKAKKRNVKVKLDVQRYILGYLSKHPCVDCDEADPAVLEFDHREHKLKEVSSLISRRYSLQRIKEEVKKCDIRCANCHRRKTAKDFGWFKNRNALVA